MMQQGSEAAVIRIPFCFLIQSHPLPAQLEVFRFVIIQLTLVSV